MKTFFPIFTIFAVALLAGCSGSKEQPAAAAAASEKSAEPESRVKRGTNGEVIVTLDTATRNVMGLQTSALESAQLNREVKGYGHVLDVSPLVALVADLTTAQAASEASQAEFKRLKTLAEQNNASERALQAAEATAVRDQTQVEATRLRLLAGWGSAIASRPDLPALIQSLGSLTNALIEIDLPAGEALSSAPLKARLTTLSEETTPVEAQFISAAPMVDPQMQGRGFLFLVTQNASRFAPGAAVTGLLSLPGEAQSGVAVPRRAILRFNGTTWVYRQTSDDTFERLEVVLDRPLENGWFVHESLKPGEKLVTVGAQQILSEELKGAGE